MSDPQRLLHDEDATDFERSLVRSWRQEQPSHAARDATLVTLGLGAGAAVTAGAGTAAAAGGSFAPKAAVGVVFLKWWALSTVAVGSVVGGAAYAARTQNPPVVVSSQSVATAQPNMPPSEMITPTPPRVDRAHRAFHPRSPSSSLNEEVAEVDRARVALESNEPSRAIDLVDAYERKHPRGSFVQEAEVLRVQALLARGDRATAERAANHFLVAYPNSPHGARVRSLLGSP